ncbi:MAG TPA: hypothetical protein VMN37_06210 [Gemmatimonadales bacterium]|nr:hypothetical protein [Gemmatimonadales bacterium]
MVGGVARSRQTYRVLDPEEALLDEGQLDLHFALLDDAAVGRLVAAAGFEVESMLWVLRPTA